MITKSPMNGMLAATALIYRCCDRFLDLKDAFLFECWDVLEQGCDRLIDTIFHSPWGLLMLPVGGWIALFLARSIQSLPQHAPWFADQLWDVFMSFWPQQLLAIMVICPFIGIGAIVGILIHAAICAVARIFDHSMCLCTGELANCGISSELDTREQQQLHDMSANGAADQSPSPDGLQAKLAAPKESNSKLHDEIRMLRSTRDKNAQTIIELRKQASNAKKQEEEIHTLSLKRDQDAQAIFELQDRVSQSGEREQDLQGQITLLREAEKAALRRRADDAEKKVVELEDKVETLQGEAETLESEAVDMSKKFGEVVESLKTATAELKAHADEAAKTSNKAWAAFTQSFSEGFHILPAASTDFQCGFYAIIESIKGLNYVDKSRKLPVPSPSELVDAMNLGWIISTGAPKVTEGPAATAAGLNGWVSLDELFMTLNLWATTYNLKFQIGHIKELGSSEGEQPDPDKHQGSSRPDLLFSPYEDDPERIVCQYQCQRGRVRVVYTATDLPQEFDDWLIPQSSKEWSSKF
ncbi:MAG: hypothetical protein Q9221_001035 [Calogaya cf. arnoldii]